MISVDRSRMIDSTPKNRLLILANASGKPLPPHRASEGVRQWRDKARLSDDLRLYDARGTAATLLLNADLSLAEIANHMGWSVRYAADVIEHYARVSPDETDAVLMKLAKAKGKTVEQIHHELWPYLCCEAQLSVGGPSESDPE